MAKRQTLLLVLSIHAIVVNNLSAMQDGTPVPHYEYKSLTPQFYVVKNDNALKKQVFPIHKGLYSYPQLNTSTDQELHKQVVSATFKINRAILTSDSPKPTHHQHINNITERATALRDQRRAMENTEPQPAAFFTVATDHDLKQAYDSLKGSSGKRYAYPQPDLSKYQPRSITPNLLLITIEHTLMVNRLFFRDNFVSEESIAAHSMLVQNTAKLAAQIIDLKNSYKPD
jgi:hypothetical protein